MKISGRYAIYQNGALIGHGSLVNQNKGADIPAITLSAPTATPVGENLWPGRQGRR